MNYKILYEDSSIIAVDKPQGLATGFGHGKNLCEILFNDYRILKEVEGYKKDEGGLLNRLDNETGGIVLFAKNNNSFHYYSNLMKNKEIEKKYIAVVQGKPYTPEGVIDIPIGHHNKNIKKMVVIDGKNKYRGRPQQAKTAFKLIQTNERISILELSIKKGIRHQIRVHLAYNGLPIIGDKLYNKDNENFIYPYHFLYCYYVVFTNIENRKIEVYSDIPFMEYVNKLIY